MSLSEIRETAFAKWMREQDRTVAAQYLVYCVREGGPDSLIWDLLALTGDETYGPDTFFKAVDLIQQREESA